MSNTSTSTFASIAAAGVARLVWSDPSQPTDPAGGTLVRPGTTRTGFRDNRLGSGREQRREMTAGVRMVWAEPTLRAHMTKAKADKKGKLHYACPHDMIGGNIVVD